jgi:hypothetical protein
MVSIVPSGSGRLLIFLSLLVGRCRAFVPFLDGGKEMPALYNGWLNGQIAKQVSEWKIHVIACRLVYALSTSIPSCSDSNEAGREV